MKILRINSHEKTYGIDMNDCMNYKIAGACSAFEKRFFKLYCAYWATLTNWSKYSSAEIRKIILNKLGLELGREKIDENNFLSKIKSKIAAACPVLLLVSPSTLFFSIVYKNDGSVILNHELLITGYNDANQIIYIRENSINKDFIYRLIKSHPFFEYQLTYQMVEEIFKLNCKLFNNYGAMCFKFLTKIEEKDIHDIEDELFNLLLDGLRNDNDQLILSIEEVILNSSFSKKFLNEQFHRNYYKSLYAIFNFIGEKFNLIKSVEFLDLKSNYLTTRYNIINFLTKKSIKNDFIHSDQLYEIINKIHENNQKLLDYLCMIKNCNVDVNEKKENLLLVEGTKIITDSEKMLKNGLLFSANSFLKLQEIEDENNFWISNDADYNHWLQIEFPGEWYVNNIIIENSKYKTGITADYQILISFDNQKWETIKNVKDNDEYVNNFIFENIKTRYIKINITKPNKSFNKTCIMRNLYIFGYKG